jgi:hypothetical protein
MQEFRPRRLVWKSPDRFLLVGLTKSSELQRSFLRFKTAEEASRAASAVREIGVIVEEPLAAVDEIQVQVRFLYTLGELFVLAYAFSIRLLILGLLAFVFFSVLDFGPPVSAVLIVLYVIVFVWGLWERTRRRTDAWLRFEGKSFAVRTEHDWRTMVPNAIEWKSTRSFVLKGSGTKVDILLPTEEDAARVAQRLRTGFPKIKEAPLMVQR